MASLLLKRDRNASLKQAGLLQDEGVAVIKNRVQMDEYKWQPSLDDILFKLEF